jgi:hypothetical protein|tara:strand:+ start:6733 stop:7401 length:669 start_codon:yes stop_codon:yes gene_type:complete
MSLKLNLVVERPDLSDEFEYIEEETNKNSPSNLYIKGPYMMAEGVNRNNRLYPKEELVREVARYNEEMVVPGRAMGELNHPTSADVDLERACHIVTEITQDGNVFYGKSKVLTTPCGQIVRALINDGVKVGMSTRALGTLEEGRTHNTVKNMKLVAIDCVADPSYPKAFVNGILESKQWILADNGKYEELYDKFEKSVSSLPKKDIDKFLTERILNFINKLH